MLAFEALLEEPLAGSGAVSKRCLLVGNIAHGD